MTAQLNESSADWAAGRLSGFQTVIAFIDYCAAGHDGWDTTTVTRLRDAVRGMAESCADYASAPAELTRVIEGASQ